MLWKIYSKSNDSATKRAYCKAASLLDGDVRIKAYFMNSSLQIVMCFVQLTYFMTDENITDVETETKKAKAEAEGKAKKISSKIKDKADDILDKAK